MRWWKLQEINRILQRSCWKTSREKSSRKNGTTWELYQDILKALNLVKYYEGVIKESKSGLDLQTKLDLDEKSHKLSRSQVFINLMCEIGHACL